METLHKPRVLYIDDEVDNLVVFKSAFRRHYDVSVASSGKEALDILSENPVELIITDQRMPEMTGIELLKQLPEEPETIRIILTGYSDVEAIIEAINLGKVYRYITKPWDKSDLKLTIDNALETLGLKVYNKELVEKLEKYNADLELKVEERTREISMQHQEIEKQKILLEKEKDKADRLLLNILPESVAEELKQTGKSAARRFNDVSVLFADFKNFTGISDSIPAEDVVSHLDYCFQAFDEIINKHGVEKIKTIGDAYMCASGLPNPDASRGENIVRAAIEMQEFLQGIKGKKNAILHELRIGLNTGPVVAGVVGKIKFAYDIWGDTVNTAARMENASEVGRINISESTKELLGDRFEYEYRGELDVKGKGKMKMYYLNY